MSYSPTRSWRKRVSIGAMLGAATLAPFIAPAGSASAAPPSGFAQVNLVSDVPGLAQVTDVRMSNPWGITMGPSTPLWVNNDNTATSQVWAGANGTDPYAETEDQQSLRQLARDVAIREVEPRAHEHDESGDPPLEAAKAMAAHTAAIEVWRERD